MKTLLEFVRPHPTYGQYGKVGNVTKHGQRAETTWDSSDGTHTLHYGESPPGQSFVWLTKNNEDAKDSRLEFKVFKKYALALRYLKDRYNVNLTGLKSFLLTDPKTARSTDKYYWKGSK